MRTTVDRAGHADIPALVELMSEFYGEPGYTLDPDWARASFEQLLHDRARGAAWIARRGAEAAGHVVLALRHNMEFGGLSGVIDDLFVRPQFRRQGVGSALLVAVFDACREQRVAAIHVEVDPGGVAACSLYQAFGFRGYGTVRQTLVVQPGSHEHPRLMDRIATARLTLEPQVAAHADEMFAVLSDPAIYAYENEPPPSVEWLRERFARLESRQSPAGGERWLNWVIRLPSSGLIGFVQATVFAEGRAAIAYVLGSRHWGKGYASEAVQAMSRELAARHRVHTLSAVLKRRNAPSIRLLERLGFTIASQEMHAHCGAEADELVMVQSAGVFEAGLLGSPIGEKPRDRIER
jgi:RimJ/RimL family protein N-acetyltransferase